MTTIDTPRLNQAVGDLAAAISGLLVHLGDRLGLYRAMAGSGPMTPTDLAERTGTHERYVREWLSNQAAGGYVTYDADDGTFELGAEQALVLAHESPVFLAGAFETIASCYADHDAFVRAFTTGDGIDWRAHDERCTPERCGCSGPATRRTWCRPGSRPSTAWSRSSRRGPWWPTSAVVSAPPR